MKTPFTRQDQPIPPPTYSQLPAFAHEALTAASELLTSRMETLTTPTRTIDARDILPVGDALLRLSSVTCLVGDMLDGTRAVSPADLSDHERDRHVQMRIQPNCESGRELTTRLVGGVRKKSSSRQLGFGKRASLTPKGGSVSSGASGAGAGDAMSPSRCRCREVLGLVDLERELLRRFPEQGSEKTRVMSPDVQDHVVAVLSEHVEECTQTLEIIMAEEAPAPREGGIRGLLKGGWKIGGSKEERRTRKAEKAAAVLYGVANPLRT